MLLASAGTETTEAAIKLARVHGSSIRKEKIGIIAINGNWHGRTMGASMLSEKNEQSKWVSFFDKNIHHIDFPYPWINGDNKNFLSKSLKRKFKNKFNFKKKFVWLYLKHFKVGELFFIPKIMLKKLHHFAKKIKFYFALMRCKQALEERVKNLVLNIMV